MRVLYSSVLFGATAGSASAFTPAFTRSVSSSGGVVVASRTSVANGNIGNTAGCACPSCMTSSLSAGCGCASCTSSKSSSGCKCSACSSTALRMASHSEECGCAACMTVIHAAGCDCAACSISTRHAVGCKCNSCSM